MGKPGLEPGRSYEHMILNHARLPIPALPHAAESRAYITVWTFTPCRSVRARVESPSASDITQAIVRLTEATKKRWPVNGDDQTAEYVHDALLPH